MKSGIDTMREAIGIWGTFAHGDDPEGTAQEWIEFGFSADDAVDWIMSRCFKAKAAAGLRSVGITPQQAAVEVPGADPDPDDPGDELASGIVRPERGAETIGYLAAYGAMTPADALAWLKGRGLA